MKVAILLCLVFFFPATEFFKLLPKDLPKFKHPCTPDNPKREKLCTAKRRFGTAEGFSFGKIGKRSNVYCKVFGMCFGFSTESWHNQGTWNPHAHAKQEAAERLKKEQERMETEEKQKKVEEESEE